MELEEEERQWKVQREEKRKRMVEERRRRETERARTKAALETERLLEKLREEVRGWVAGGCLGCLFVERDGILIISHVAEASPYA